MDLNYCRDCGAMVAWTKNRAGKSCTVDLPSITPANVKAKTIEEGKGLIYHVKVCPNKPPRPDADPSTKQAMEYQRPPDSMKAEYERLNAARAFNSTVPGSNAAGFVDGPPDDEPPALTDEEIPF